MTQGLEIGIGQQNFDTRQSRLQEAESEQEQLKSPLKFFLVSSRPEPEAIPPCFLVYSSVIVML